jgi:hypothetical protein
MSALWQPDEPSKPSIHVLHVSMSALKKIILCDYGTDFMPLWIFYILYTFPTTGSSKCLAQRKPISAVYAVSPILSENIMSSCTADRWRPICRTLIRYSVHYALSYATTLLFGHLCKWLRHRTNVTARASVSGVRALFKIDQVLSNLLWSDSHQRIIKFREPLIKSKDYW